MKAPIDLTLTLEEVAERFKQLRSVKKSVKKKEERIPESLWTEALGLVGR